MIRPGRGDITTTRSERNTASGIECVTNTVLVPVCAQMPQQLGLQPLAGHLVQRAERLVHQQQRRVHGQRPRDRDPLLHAAGQLGRVVPGEVGQPDQRQHLLGARLAVAPRASAAQLQRQLHVAPHGPPLEEAGLLERDAVLLVEPGAPGRLAGHRDRAGGRRIRSAISRSSVLLPQPDGPISDTNCAVADGQVDVGQRGHLVGPARR